MMSGPNDLRYFSELCQTLNFSRASERLGISQPALSASIKRLENNLNVSLFTRRKTGLIVTPAGRQLLAHAKQLLQLWDQVKSEAQASHNEVRGNVILGCHPSVALVTLPKFLPELLKKYPALTVELKHDLSRKIAEGIVNFSVDIGIVVNPIKHPDLIIQKLYSDEIAFWQSEDNENKTVLICDPDLIQTQWLLKRLQKMHINFERVITSNNLEVIAKLVENGSGVGLLPSAVALSQANKLIRVAKMPQYHDEIALIYRHENRDIQSIKEIVQRIKSTVK